MLFFLCFGLFVISSTSSSLYTISSRLYVWKFLFCQYVLVSFMCGLLGSVWGSLWLCVVIFVHMKASFVVVPSSYHKQRSTYSFSSCLVVGFFPRNFHKNGPGSRPYIKDHVINLSSWLGILSVVSLNLLKYSLTVSRSFCLYPKIS